MFEQKNIGIKLNFSILLQGFLINVCQAQSCNFYLHFILKILQKNTNNNTTSFPRYI